MFDFLSNLTPEQRDQLLGLGAGLMSGGRNNAEALSKGLFSMMQAKNEGNVLRSRDLDAKQNRAYQQQQMDEQKRGLLEQQGIRDIYSRNTMPGNLTPNDDEGNPMPAAPQGINLQGLQQGLMGAGPAGLREAASISGLMAKQQPKYHVVGGALVPEPTAPGQQSAPVYQAPEKKEGPKNGQIREVKTGGKLFTYEYGDNKWNKIAEAPLFKPEGPEKPEKPPAGYRYDQAGNLAFIPGGPADPASGRKTAVPTEDERRSAGLAVRMENAIQTMGKFPDAGKPEMFAEGVRKIPLAPEALANAATSKERQQVEASQLDALDAALTLATGAAYTKEQLKNLSKSYFPQMGDDPATVKAKEENLKKVIQTARIRAGRAEGDINRVNGGGASGGWGGREIK